MATDSTLTREQLSTLFLNTELGGNTRHLDHFAYAKEGTSTYSFGLVQFDVGGNPRPGASCATTASPTVTSNCCPSRGG